MAAMSERGDPDPLAASALDELERALADIDAIIATMREGLHLNSALAFRRLLVVDARLRARVTVLRARVGGTGRGAPVR